MSVAHEICVAIACILNFVYELRGKYQMIH